MNAPHHEGHADRRGSRRYRQAPQESRRHHPIPLTPEGLPAATPDAPRPSPVVLVSDESRGRYPWLPPRVIAGSVWSGPRNLRVQVDESGNAGEWPRMPPRAAGEAPVRHATAEVRIEVRTEKRARRVMTTFQRLGDAALSAVSGAGGKGRVVHQDLVVVKQVDVASAKLFL